MADHYGVVNPVPAAPPESAAPRWAPNRQRGASISFGSSAPMWLP